MYGSHQLQQSCSNEQPPASQEEQPPASQDQVPTQVAVLSMSNSADIFTVPLSMPFIAWAFIDLGSVTFVAMLDVLCRSSAVASRGTGVVRFPFSMVPH